MDAGLSAFIIGLVQVVATGKKHALNKYNQFMLNTGCFLTQIYARHHRAAIVAYFELRLSNSKFKKS